MRKKEASFKRLKLFVFTGLAAIIVFVLLVSSIGKTKELGTFHKLLMELILPIQHGISFVQDGVSDIWYGYINLAGVEKNNELLRKEIKRLRAENNEYREALVANTRFKKLLDFKEAVPLPLFSASIIAYDPSVWFRTVMINHGSNDGLQKGMGVVCAEGVVGQVVGVTPHYAKVLLITDGNSAVDVTVQRTRARGILKGSSGRTCYLEYVDSREDIRPGDVIISSGLGGVFPKGLPMGRVTRVERSRPGLFQNIEVSPSIDLSKLEEVFVILQKNPLTE